MSHISLEHTQARNLVFSVLFQLALVLAAIAFAALKFGADEAKAFASVWVPVWIAVALFGVLAGRISNRMEARRTAEARRRR